MQENFFRWAVRHKWRFIRRTYPTYIPKTITNRYPSAPEEWIDFMKSFALLEKPNKSGRFLTVEDFCFDFDTEWNYDEIENFCLEQAGDDEKRQRKIVNFWNKHLPFYIKKFDVLYIYFAIDLTDGCVVYGKQPYFEKTRPVADSFTDFLEKIINHELLI